MSVAIHTKVKIGNAHHMLRRRGAITVSCSTEGVGDTLEGVVIVLSLVSLTVFDVTVRSVAIIMLSVIGLFFSLKGRTRSQTKPALVRVDNRRSNFYMPNSKDKLFRSAGLLGLSSLAIGIAVAVVISVLMAFVFATLTNSLGN